MPNPAGASLPNPANYTYDAAEVLDNVTGLIWERDVSGRVTSTWTAATTAATSPCTGGWRLPTRVELVSLLDFTRAPPTIDTAAFPDTPGDCFWSSSLAAGSSNRAWYVRFGGGATVDSSVDTLCLVRCVR
ncbi:MAG: DUF1566 domain-containing protein [Deltaproteobacteria bacterium]|nr:DUF1566 domain-containing protein [Deltaproteobacteria bacterium]